MRIIYALFLAYALMACSSEQPQTTDTSENSEVHSHEGHDHGHEGHDHDHVHSTPEEEGDGIHFGKNVTADNAILLATAIEKLQKEEGVEDLDLGEGNIIKALPTKIEGEVTEVCQMSGCWLKIKDATGKEMFVNTNHDFLVKPNIIGKTVIVEGNAYQEVTTVAELKAAATEENKTAAEVEAITEPEYGYSLMAKGLLVK